MRASHRFRTESSSSTTSNIVASRVTGRANRRDVAQGLARLSDRKRATGLVRRTLALSGAVHGRAVHGRAVHGRAVAFWAGSGPPLATNSLWMRGQHRGPRCLRGRSRAGRLAADNSGRRLLKAPGRAVASGRQSKGLRGCWKPGRAAWRVVLVGLAVPGRAREIAGAAERRRLRWLEG